MKKQNKKKINRLEEVIDLIDSLIVSDSLIRNRNYEIKIEGNKLLVNSMLNYNEFFNDSYEYLRIDFYEPIIFELSEFWSGCKTPPQKAKYGFIKMNYPWKAKYKFETFDDFKEFFNKYLI